MMKIIWLFINLNVMADEDQMKVKMYENPRRDVSVIVTAEGFYPEKISVFQNEKIKFFLTTTTSTPSCMIVSSHDFYLSAHKGELTEKEILFKDPGHYEYYCPSTGFKGVITVMKKTHQSERGIASEEEKNKKKEWTPKEYDL
ncbi:MAG: cupredoxin domain-containing protein [Bacteriovoracaceae bacterium]|nr:cupredoxin domain-containing protein [Bacteriovoracaceae bacterium]